MLLLAGCVKETEPDVIKLRSNPAIILPAVGGKSTVSFEASGDWTASVSSDSDSGWLTVSPEIGNKTVSKVTLSAVANEGPDEREATIVFTCGSASASAKVTQLPKDALVLSPSQINIGSEGGEFSIEATGNVTLNVRILASWVTLVVTKSITTQSFTFSVEPNPDYEDRTTAIIFSGGSITQTIMLTQEENKGIIADSPLEYKISARSQTLSLDIRTNTGLQVVPAVDWIHYVETRALSHENINLLIDENFSDAGRTGTVAISTGTGVSLEVTVIQAGASELFVPDDVFLGILLSKFDTDGDGNLSRAECEAAEALKINYQEYPAAADIESFEGIGCFPNLSSFIISAFSKSYRTQGNVSGTIDLTRNEKLQQVMINGLATFDGLDISGNLMHLWYLQTAFCPDLKEIKWPETSALRSINLSNCRQLSATELDFSEYFTLGSLDITNCPGIAKVLLPNGLSPVGQIEGGIIVEYVGENLKVEPVYADAVLGQVLDKVVTDSDGDGRITVLDLKQTRQLNLSAMSFYGIQGCVSSLEDLGQFPQLEILNIIGCGEGIKAPLPEALSSLTVLSSVSIRETGIYGPVPASYAGLTELYNIEISNTDISGSFPEFLFGLPDITYIDFRDNPGLGGEISFAFPENTKLKNIYLHGCNFTNSPVIVAETPEDLLGHLESDALSISFAPQVNGEAKLLYRSMADGSGPVHSDGEAVLYHAATKGPGLDVFITGDGFTAANNTVGGTLETYMKYAAEAVLNQEPFDKLKEWFNIWFVYAHSQKEGTAFGSGSTSGLKYSTFQPYVNSSTCSGNYDAIREFVTSSTGRHEPSGTVGVIMNSPNYGGMCAIAMSPLYAPGLSTGFVPAAAGFARTFVHEVMGHGFAKLGDEYAASGASFDQSPRIDNTIWPLYGMYSNFDNVSDPASVRWHDFLADYRYSSEGLGVFEGANLSNSGWYRPSRNSIMNSYFEDGGDCFNAPSREAIWQRVQLLAHPEQNWQDWASYVSNGYDREAFVSFDLTHAASASSSGKRSAPGREFPPLAPPVIIK